VQISSVNAYREWYSSGFVHATKPQFNDNIILNLYIIWSKTISNQLWSIAKSRSW